MKGYPTVFEGVLFLECDVPRMQAVAPVAVDLSFVLGAQLKNLNDVKRGLAQRAVALGCNCVANFKYGQKSRWLAIDDVAFFGNGTAGRLPQADYDEIADYIRKRDNAG
jgi:hypothetical protein